MVEIYLRMDDFEYWSSARADMKVNEGALKSADTLLHQLERLGSNSTKLTVLRGYWEVMKSFETGNFEKPIKRFTGILKADKVR